MEQYFDEDNVEMPAIEPIEYGCQFCWDKRKKKEKALMFFDQANNLRGCRFCPWCGREYLQED